MSTWLKAWRNREDRGPAQPVMELLVVAGADAGNQFTLEGEAVLVGRGQPESGQIDVVRLVDKSISRRQAWIRRDPSGTWIEHIDSAANPTLVNGSEVERARLEAGDRIEMGRVAIDVRARDGVNLSGLTEIMEGAARDSTVTGADLASQPTEPPPIAEAPTQPGPEQTLSTVRAVEESTDVRPMEVRIGELRLLGGADDLAGARFPLGLGPTRIGRADQVDVRIPEGGVSRLHAEIQVAGRAIVLVQRSQTNPTLVNGFPVLDRVELGHGDHIQLADRVVLEVILGAEDRREASAGLSSSDLSRRMEDKIDLEREIEEFSVMGTFLDVDVVSSRKMKAGDEKAEHIIVSFDRFRAYVGGICKEWNGQVLNSNGDELMCFFENATSAVLAGSAILERLADFNRDLNLLSRDFRFRLGAHTGRSLVDLNAGVAYSEVLDTAGHIQKCAEPDSLLLSQSTVDELPTGLPVTPVGELTGSGPLYRLDRILRPTDLEPRTD